MSAAALKAFIAEQIADAKANDVMLSLHVKDKVLFVYAFGPEKDLEWTRAAASTWATRIVAANSPAGAPANSRATQEKQ